MKRVLVPSPYFHRKDNDGSSTREASSRHIMYPSCYEKRNYVCRSPIEPTVINLNAKLPKLGNEKYLNSLPSKKSSTGLTPRG